MSRWLKAPHTLKAAYPPPLAVDPPPPPQNPQNKKAGVPRIVWRTWKDDKWIRECVSADRATKQVLPMWTHKVWTDVQCREFIKTTFDPLFLKAYDACNYGVMRADLWRYLVVYWYGGLYLDMKSWAGRVPEFRDASSTTFNGPKVYTSPWNLTRYKIFHPHLFTVGEFQQFWIAAEPQSPALWRVACQVAANILHLVTLATDTDALFVALPKVDCPKSRVVSTTGPVAYTYALATNEQTTPGSVVVLSHDGGKTINYLPPNAREISLTRPDHYGKLKKPLVIR